MILDNRSLTNLNGVDPDVIRVVKRAYKIHRAKGLTFTVIEGVRTPARQAQLYAQGRTAPGKIVTWTLNSRHFVNPRTGFGEAVDILPGTGWGDLKGFDDLAHSMFQASRELGVKIRWGKDWNQNGIAGEKGESDSPHFEKA